MTHPIDAARIDAIYDLIGKLTLGRERDHVHWGETLAKLSEQKAHSDNRILELQVKLKETISAVTKLAKGKSLGALGLPTEESWSSV